MSPGKHEDCEKCEEHLAWEEKLKTLEHIPNVLTDMNKLKGGLAVIIVLLPILTTIIFTNIYSNRAETLSRIKEIESVVSKKQDKIAEQVERIGENTASIRQAVAVMKNTFEMFREQSVIEHANLQRDVSNSSVKTYTPTRGRDEREGKGNR